MESLGEHRLLSAEDELRLARTIEAGVLAGHLLECGDRPVRATDGELAELVAAGRAAWQTFWLANLRLVQKLSSQEARRSGLPPEELFQEGCLALAAALQRFDPERGPFGVYAAGRIGRHLSGVSAARLGALGISTAQAVVLRRARSLRAELSQERLGEVSTAELATVLGCQPERLGRLLQHRAPIALISPDAHPGLVCDGVDPERRLFDEQVRREVARLSPELATVIALRFGLGGHRGLELAEVAQRLGVSVSTARRRERQALEALRARLDSCGIGADVLAG